MMLNYPLFASNKRIQAAARNAPPLKKGHRGYAVALLQAALIDLGYKLPVSTHKKGVPDGIYGRETEGAVWKFQETVKLKTDGVAGRNTIAKIDALMVAKTAPALTNKPPKPRPAIPATRDYRIGTNDPPVSPDRGAGVWGSASPTMSMVALKEAILQALPAAYVYIGGDAVKHLAHYFRNTGTDLKIDLVGMVNEVPSAQKLYQLEVAQAKLFVEKLPVGSHDITSTRAQGGYNEKRESKNWFFAVGGYSVWGKGRAVVSESAAGREYTLDFEYKFFDRYNWDTGKKVEIKLPLIGESVEIRDVFMGDFHRQGLAKEYNEIGSFRKTFSWKHGEAIPAGQITLKSL